MKKIIMFLMGCLLFISCISSKNDISEKNIITSKEISDYISEFEKQNPYNGTSLTLYSPEIEFPKEKMGLASFKEALGGKNIFGEVRIVVNERFEDIPSEMTSKIFKSKEKEYYNPVAIIYNGFDEFEAKYIKTGIVSLSGNDDKDIAYIDIKNNKIRKMFYGEKENNNYTDIIFFEYKKLKKDFKGFIVNDNALAATYFLYEDSVFRKTNTLYKLSKPVNFKGKNVSYFVIQNDWSNDNKEIFILIYDKEGHGKEFMTLE